METKWDMEGASHWLCSLEQTTSPLILPVENIEISQVIAEDGFHSALSDFMSFPNDPGFPGSLFLDTPLKTRVMNR